LHIETKETLVAKQWPVELVLCFSEQLGAPKKLSDAYRVSLLHVDEEAVKKGLFTESGLSQNIADEFLALLECLYGLRDALIEYFYYLKMSDNDQYQLKKLRKYVGEQQGSKAAKIIDDSMFAGTLENRLIYRMSLLRSLAQHSLGKVNPVIADAQHPKTANGAFGMLTWITFPLYDNWEKMEKIERGDRTALDSESVKAEWKRFFATPSHTDALEFSVQCFKRLLEIGAAIADEEPLKPREIVLTEKMIDGEVRFVDRGPVA